MIIDGKSIAEKIYSKLEKDFSKMNVAPSLTVFTCNPNFETKKFLGIKQRVANRMGIKVDVVMLPSDVTTDYCIEAIKNVENNTNGIIVQLPFPDYVDIKSILATIPDSHDIDAFNIKDDDVVSPVLGAVQEVLNKNNIEVRDKKCVVVGAGRLVGVPVAEWLSKIGGDVTVVTSQDTNLKDKTLEAEIIMLGAGSPSILKPDMISEGVVIIDAGTSESAGELKGDADPECAKKASLLTPVPGGIGPITVAILFRNLLILTKRQ